MGNCWCTPGKAFDGSTNRFVRTPIPRVCDGDTIIATFPRADLLPSRNVCVSVRILGIDTPERHSKDPAEKEAAERATATMQEIVAAHTIFTKLDRHDKYGGRFLGTPVIHFHGTEIPLSRLMVACGHAREYAGNRKIPFAAWYDPAKIKPWREVLREMSRESQ